MKVRYRPTGELGDIPDDKFDPLLFERVNATPSAIPSLSQPQPPRNDLASNIGGILGNILSPFKPVAAATTNLPNLLNYIVQKVQGNPQAFQNYAQTYRQNPLVNQETLNAAERGDIGGVLTDIGKTGAGITSFAVPFGRGASLLSKILAPGAAVGALQGISEEGATPQSVAGNAVLGAGGAGAFSALGPIAKLLGKGFGKTEEGLAVRTLAPSPSQQVNFLKDTGEKLGDFLKTRNLQGAAYNNILNRVKPLQDIFDSFAQNPDLQIAKGDISKAFKSKIAELNTSTLPEQKAKATYLQEVMDNVGNTFKGASTGADVITALRREADDVIKNFQFDETSKGKLQVLRDIYQGIIRDAADKAGIEANGMGAKDIGVELSKYYKLLDIAEKQQFKGKGGSPIGLLDWLGAGVGGIIGGFPGAALTGLGMHLAQTPMALGAASKGAGILENILGGAGNVAERLAGQQVTGQLAARAPAGLLGLIMPMRKQPNEKYNTSNIPVGQVQSNLPPTSIISPPVNQTNPLEGWTVDGKPISAADARLIKGIADYKIDISKITSLRTNERTRIAGLVAQYDPSWDMTQYPARLALRKDFTSGKAANNIRSLNTAVGHLQSLANAGQELNNTNLPAINAIKNAKGIVEQPKVVAFDKAVNAVAGEMSTLFKGTSGTDQEITSWKSGMNSSQTPSEIKASVEKMIELMGSRLAAFNSQWEAGIGKPKDFYLLSPQSRKILQGLGVDVNTIDPVITQ